MDSEVPGVQSPNDKLPPESVEFLDAVEESSEKAVDFIPITPRERRLPEKETRMTSSLDLFSSLVKAGLVTKRSTLRLDTWIDLALTLDGRDKITKVLQYAARLMAWYWTGTVHERRFSSLKASIASSRKAYRFGRTIIELHRLQLSRKASPSRPPVPTEKVTWQGHALSIAENIIKDVRLLGMAGYWALDNTSFLASSGVFDNYQMDSKSRAARRSEVQTRVGNLANRSYFVSALTGLWMNANEFLKFQQDQESVEDNDLSPHDRVKLHSKALGLALALVKSICDVLVFSNNPGVDLWKRRYGSKLHELVHCTAALASASVVLYKNLPAA